MHKYEIILYWSNEDKAFVAEVPQLTGCAAHGDTQIGGVGTRQRGYGLVDRHSEGV